MRIDTHYEKETDKKVGDIVLESKRLLCRELGNDLILSGNILSDVYS